MPCEAVLLSGGFFKMAKMLLKTKKNEKTQK
jgi:hypothetical protein